MSVPANSTTNNQYDPYDFKHRRVQATDGPNASYYEKRLKLPHSARFKLENIAARHGYPSMDSLIRDFIQRGLHCMGQQESDIEATELATLWEFAAAADAKIEADRQVDHIIKTWDQLIRDADTPEQLNKLVWEANEYIRGLPQDSPHRRKIESKFMRFLGGKTNQ